MNNLTDKNTNIEQTSSYGNDEIRQTTIENDEQTVSKHEPIHLDSEKERGTEKCPDGQVFDPVTGKCV